MSFETSLCTSEPSQNRKCSPTVKIIDECVLNSQEGREEERMKSRGEAWRREVLISTL